MITRHKRTHAMIAANLKPYMTFGEAGDRWIESMDFSDPSMGFVMPKTLRGYRQQVHTLKKHFGNVRLADITASDLRAYQQLRASGALATPDHPRPSFQVGPGANANTINKELKVLMRLLLGSGAWTPVMEEQYMPLRHQQPDIQRALAPDEQQRFLRVAASKPQWETARWYATLSLNTTLGTNEMRSLRFCDIDLDQSIVKVNPRGAKNVYRIRTIPLNAEAHKAAEMLIGIARRKGARAPSDHVFPFRISPNEYDPTRHMGESGLSRSWRELRAAAGVPWFREYDLRHTAITRLAEAGTPIAVIMEMAGHIDTKMSRHYTHISQNAKVRAVMNAAAAFKTSTERKNKPAESQVTTATDSISIPSLISTLKAAGVSADEILRIIAGAQGGVSPEVRV